MSRKTFRRIAYSALAIAVVIATSAPIEAIAAVRKCASVVASPAANAATELDAKKRALAQWRTEALKHGEGWDSWRLAYDKSLRCIAKDNAFECVALGSPCIVDQTPRSPPKGKGTGI